MTATTPRREARAHQRRLPYMTRPIALALGLATALATVTFGSGCGRSITIDHWTPPDADIRGARTLAITDAYGRDSSVAAVVDIALETASQSGWFVDVIHTPRLETDGRDVWLRDGDMRAQALYVRLDVLEDNAIVVTSQDETGAIVETLSAHTLLALSVADSNGLIIDERELEGVHERSGPVSSWDIDNALDASARAAVQAALATVTPRPAHTNVRLDERDERVNAVLAVHFDAAGPDRITRDEVVDRLAKIDGAPALWNRAALLESVDERDAASPLYAQALAHDDAADWYAEEHAEARARADAALELALD